MRKMLSKELIKRCIVFILFLLLCIVVFQIYDCQNNTKRESVELFDRIEEIMDNNEQELESVTEEYDQLCLDHADAVAYILGKDPAVMDSVQELKEVAALVQVDEIHIFDETGTIVKGTIPKYYHMSVEDGEQIGYFAPMFQDKTMRLCQEVTPNTSEGKKMQYAAVWNASGEYVVQVGVAPKRVLDVISKNQISYVFSHFTVNENTQIYALDLDSGEILGATDESVVGQTFSATRMNKKNTDKEGDFHAYIQGKAYYCVAQERGDLLLVQAIRVEEAYNNMGITIPILALCMCVLAILLIVSIVRYLNAKIVKSIEGINDKLALITEGKFDEKVEITATPEFAALSRYINTMIKSLLGFTDKISNVLDLAQLRAGIYEYNTKMPGVRVTNQIRYILNIDTQQTELLEDQDNFEQYLEELRKNPVEGFVNTYQMQEEPQRYVRMEAFQRGNSKMGILLDVTDTVLRARQLEQERDRDALTGLYNRKGLENQLQKLSEELEETHKEQHSAFIMLDADGLKEVNDTYGHKAGDAYLCAIAQLLCEQSPPGSILARQGGDEFLLFYYGFESEQELLHCIDRLKDKRDHESFKMPSGEVLVLRYSIGWVDGTSAEYEACMRVADQRMYEEKSRRKQQKEHS